MTGAAHRELQFLHPGPLDQPTGGSVYDARMIGELRHGGWSVSVHQLAGDFPEADEAARRSAGGTIAGLRDGALAVIDGLALSACADALDGHAARIRADRSSRTTVLEPG